MSEGRKINRIEQDLKFGDLVKIIKKMPGVKNKCEWIDVLMNETIGLKGTISLVHPGTSEYPEYYTVSFKDVNRPIFSTTWSYQKESLRKVL